MGKASFSFEQRVDNARRGYPDAGRAAGGFLPEVVLRSWERSRGFGLEFRDRRLLESRAAQDCSTLTERHRTLLNCAVPEMQSLHRALNAAGWIVAVVDAEGIVLRSVSGISSSYRELEQIFAVGRNLSEAAVGTCSPGCALAEGVPVVIHANEHFLDECHRFICAAVPLFGPSGEIVGALDVTRQHNGDASTVMEPLAMAGRAIENRILAGADGALVMRFHCRPEMLGTALEGMLVFTEDGALLGANQTARRLLSIPRGAVSRLTFDDFFDGPQNTFALAMNGAGELKYLRVGGGIEVSARFEARRARRFAVGSPAEPVADIPGADSSVAAALRVAQRAFARDIPVLISGETGTGKELLARTLHEGGPRSGGPFVAINCSSIPAGLIESEFFGYEDGAFTGGRRGGAAGKFEQARGGTLFLDEIGDMPLELQGRLLRVLQEKSFSRVGGNKLIPLDTAVISATHRDLESMLASGNFREDLFYRIKGVRVTLPPLRERRDILPVIERVLEQEAGGRPPALSERALEAMLSYAWPGNIRQLVHVLRLALILADGEPRIDLCHLSDELREMFGDVTGHSTSCATDPVQANSLQRWELDRIHAVLHQYAGNVSATARALGIARATLYRKLKLLDAISRDGGPA